MKYRPDIDGLRAVAILPVVFYHAGFSLFTGGFVGVDVFFVISGYLITQLIFHEVRDDRFTYFGFYQRRVRRLFPALFFMVLCCLLPAYWLMLPAELEDFGQSVASLTLFASNLLFWSETGYFATSAELKPLLHTWSLAIEEQYYLFFPMLLLAINKIPGKPFLWVTAGIFLASLLWSSWSAYVSPDAAFYLLPSRTWELLMGSLIAMSGMRVQRYAVAESMSAVGLLLIGVAIFGFDGGTAFPGLAALLPCLGTAMLIVGGSHGDTRTAAILSDRRIVFVGLISYSLYLWHWPLLVFAKHYVVGPLSFTATWLAIICAFVVSVASWRFVERPFRGRPGLFNPQQLFRTAGAFMLALVGIGLVYDLSEGLPARLPGEVVKILDVAKDRPANRKRCEGIAPQKLALQNLCLLNDSEAPPTVLVWGDSHANMLAAGVGTVLQALGKNGVFAVANGCVPALGVGRAVRDTDVDCMAFNEAVLAMLAHHPEIEMVILSARWALHATGLSPDPHAKAIKYLKSADRVASTVVENSQLFSQGMETTLTAIRGLDRQVIILSAIPEALGDVPDIMAKSAWRGRSGNPTVAREDFDSRQADVWRTFSDLSARHALHVIALHEPFCSPRVCVLSAQGLPLYFDDNHLARTGLNFLMPFLEQQLTSVFSNNQPL